LLKEIEASADGATESAPGNRVARRRVGRSGEVFARRRPAEGQLAPPPLRPNTLDYVRRLFTEFAEIHGDRRRDDHAIIADCPGTWRRCWWWDTEGRTDTRRIYRNFGYAKPEGYRKAIRLMKFAEKFGRPVIVFVDTPAAYPGIESEERGVAEAIAYNLREMAVLAMPVIILITGEGGSGGALGIAIGDRVLIQEYAIYSVIPPEGCAAILWRDANRKVEATEALKITAPDMLRLGVVDEIVPEPIGGAHAAPEQAASLLDKALSRALAEVAAEQPDVRLERRYEKFRRMGRLGVDFVQKPQ
jgi:acetyl-CoA carboxylase carboxyl transferase subunit alpha